MWGTNGTQKHFNTRTARHDMTVPTTYQRWTSATGKMSCAVYPWLYIRSSKSEMNYNMAHLGDYQYPNTLQHQDCAS